MKKILIVEDEFEIGESVRTILEDEGYEAILASDGSEALEMLKKIPHPHLIVSDIMMPKMDGYQLLENLKNHEAYKNIPVIFMSAGNPSEVEKKIKWNAFLKKPFDIDDLVEIVNKFVQQEKDNFSGGVHA